MRKLLKIILPPLVCFLIFAGIIKFGPFTGRVKGLSQIGDDTVYGLIAYYKIFAPLLILTALLTQLLIVMPLWRKVTGKPKTVITILILIATTSAILAAGISYVTWDRATGTGRLIAIFFFMAGVQVFYWLINFGTLFLIDNDTFKARPKPKQSAG